jgi:hypothetical protein
MEVFRLEMVPLISAFALKGYAQTYYFRINNSSTSSRVFPLVSMT